MAGPDRPPRQHRDTAAAVERVKRHELRLELHEKLVKLESNHLAGKVSKEKYWTTKTEIHKRLAEIDQS